MYFISTGLSSRIWSKLPPTYTFDPLLNPQRLALNVNVLTTLKGLAVALIVVDVTSWKLSQLIPVELVVVQPAVVSPPPK